MIARVYGKWIKDAQPEAGNKAVAMFSKKPKSMVRKFDVVQTKKTSA